MSAHDVTKRLRSRGRALIERRDFGLAPRGISPFIVLRRTLGEYRAEVTLDVGANVGQSASTFLRVFPSAQIWCLEPVPATFAELERTLGQRVRACNVGLSDTEGNARMDTDSPSVFAKVVDHANTGTEVELRTLDGFCGDYGIDRIDYLKIDTEGHDLNVVDGGRVMFERRAVQAVQVEAGMHPENKTHVSFERLKEGLEDYGYRCFGIYDQTSEFIQHKPFLRRVNAVFVPC